MTDDEEARRQAKDKFEAGQFRAALHLWDSLEHPELLTDLEISLREVALRERDR